MQTDSQLPATPPGSAPPGGSEDCDDGACERCGRYYDLRDGQEPTPLCDECAHVEVETLRNALLRIYTYPVHSEPVGGAMAMQDIAHDALYPPNAEVSEAADKKR